MTALPLTALSSGDEGIVLSQDGDSRCGSRLAELGLASGESVHVLQSGSPMLLRIGESRVCVRSDEAAQISVLCHR
ncbi:MAG: ferrous iron transport protein A [Deltaproteobacteria bacterium]|nr:ferrous iron transport protein A [Deltaproteobacteria bacterium]